MTTAKTSKPNADTPLTRRRLYRSATSGKIYSRNVVAGARVAVAANKKARSGPVPADIADMASAEPIESDR